MLNGQKYIAALVCWALVQSLLPHEAFSVRLIILISPFPSSVFLWKPCFLYKKYFGFSFNVAWHQKTLLSEGINLQFFFHFSFFQLSSTQMYDWKTLPLVTSQIATICIHSAKFRWRSNFLVVNIRSQLPIRNQETKAEAEVDVCHMVRILRHQEEYYKNNQWRQDHSNGRRPPTWPRYEGDASYYVGFASFFKGLPFVRSSKSYCNQLPCALTARFLRNLKKRYFGVENQEARKFRSTLVDRMIYSVWKVVNLSKWSLSQPRIRH